MVPIQYCSNTLMFVMCCSKWTRCVVKSAMQPSTVALIVSGNMHSFTRELANAPSSNPNLLQKLQESQVDNMQFTCCTDFVECKIVKFLFPPVGLLNASLHFARVRMLPFLCTRTSRSHCDQSIGFCHVEFELSRVLAFIIVCQEAKSLFMFSISCNPLQSAFKINWQEYAHRLHLTVALHCMNCSLLRLVLK